MILLTTKPGQAKDCTNALVEQGLPLLKQQPGFIDAVALASDTERDQVVCITIWRNKEDAEKYANGQGRQVLESIRPLLQEEPTLRSFNLQASTMHNIGIGRAASAR
jgi:heme-degrading monooxygenase HmoA